ncbi:MAG: type II secretion system F family protein [Pirellulaceae bacterium]|nr:type II secretion system F family protein [Planctomycetales bacterium]
MQMTATDFLFPGVALVVFLIGRRWIQHNRHRVVDDLQLVKAPRFGAATGAIAQLIPLPEKTRQTMAQELVVSGRYHLSALDDFLATRNLLFFSAILLVVAVFAAGIADGRELWFGTGGVVVCVLTYAVPRVALSASAQRRKNQIEKGIPDALDMIAMSVAGGTPVNAAVRSIARQFHRSHPSLAEELRIVARQADSGSVEQAFAGFARRVELPEVAAWCALMAQSHRLGGRIVDSLNDYANRIRRDRQNRAERAGNTASIKLLLPVVLCLSPPIAIMLIGPAILDFRDFLNRNGDEISASADALSDATSTSASSP